MKGEGGWVVGVDDAVAEVADEKIVAEDTEAGGSDGDSPGRVEVAASDSAGDEVAVGVEDVDDSVARTDGLCIGRDGSVGSG